MYHRIPTVSITFLVANTSTRAALTLFIHPFTTKPTVLLHHQKRVELFLYSKSVIDNPATTVSLANQHLY